jgi:hypothetical protein
MPTFKYILITLVHISLALTILPATTFAESENARFHVRLYGGAHSIQPTDLNNVVTPVSIEEFKSLPIYGLEVAYAVLPFVTTGVRMEAGYTRNKETSASPTVPDNPYYSSISTQETSAVVRLTVLHTQVVHFDVFGALGSTKASVDVRTGSGEATYTAQNSLGGTQSYGASIGGGWSSVYLYLEGGHRNVTLSDITREGHLSNNITSLDLSGNYVKVGLLFAGLPEFIKISRQ